MKTLNKLIDLINQREKEKLGERREDLPYDIGLDECHIISREDGFIKWLVDNDKIDRDKCGLENKGFRNWYNKGIALVENYDNDTYKVTEFYRPYFQLLMLLSIQNEPLEFLNDILK